MRLPSIHLNGSGRASLFESVHRAYHAVELAREALRACAPHGRDYYIQGESAVQEAIREHLARDEKLMMVQEELETLIGHLAEH